MRIKVVLLAFCAVFMLGAVAASPAFAEEKEEHAEWLLKANSTTFKSTASGTKLEDESTKSALTCKESTIGGTLKTKAATGEPIAEITEASWNKGEETCEGPAGFKFSVTPLTTSPWWLLPIWQLVKNKSLVWGSIERVLAHIHGPLCSFLVVGKTGALIHTNLKPITILLSNALNKEFGASELTVEKVEGCLGLVKNGDKSYFEGSYELSEPTELELS